MQQAESGRIEHIERNRARSAQFLRGLIQASRQRQAISGKSGPLSLQSEQETSPAAGPRPPERKNVVTLTATAAAKVIEAQARDGRRYLRVVVRPSGEGFIRELDFADEPTSDDYVGESQGVPIVVDRTRVLDAAPRPDPPDGGASGG